MTTARSSWTRRRTHRWRRPAGESIAATRHCPTEPTIEAFSHAMAHLIAELGRDRALEWAAHVVVVLAAEEPAGNANRAAGEE
ncbi:MAG: hypothetical protein PVI35_05800 [Acidimicrobiia bacterium]|jgi:hypothetical protein